MKEALETNGIAVDQFIQLSMLNLNKHQFERVRLGKIRDFDRYNKEVPFRDKTPLEEICKNPYLIVEEYLPQDNLQDNITGEELDFPIELFKVDIAYFPDGRVMPRIDLQRSISLSDKRRLRCVIMNYLKSLEQKGDCFEEVTELESALRQYPLFYQQGNELTLGIDILKRHSFDRDTFFEEAGKLKITEANDTRYFYLKEIYETEKRIGDYIDELLRQPKNSITYRNQGDYFNTCSTLLGSKIGDSFIKEDFLLERDLLYRSLFKERLFVLAGGPGSGKSHELLNILKEIESQGENYLLLAPQVKRP